MNQIAMNNSNPLLIYHTWDQIGSEDSFSVPFLIQCYDSKEDNTLVGVRLRIAPIFCELSQIFVMIDGNFAETQLFKAIFSLKVFCFATKLYSYAGVLRVGI